MSDLHRLIDTLEASIVLDEGGSVTVRDAAVFREHLDELVQIAIFGEGDTLVSARHLIREAAAALGILPASINDLYLARGRGETPKNFTVPAMNLRAMSYDAARAVFRAAKARDAGAFIFEIARSEIAYTEQRPAEYATCVLAAAIKEGHQGPVFIQGDHFQVSAKRYGLDAAAELGAVRNLTTEALDAGFYNIDIDTSTLVDLNLETLDEQQRLNATLCAEITQFIRDREPDEITVSVGGEIGEVGGSNSTEPELRAFMKEYAAALGEGVVGLSKVSIQTGTSHGGIVLPDGTLAQVKVDFETLGHLSEVARLYYGVAGTVQHGASTLPESAFGRFAEVGACEVHLATNFQNMLFDRLPEGLRAEIYEWLRITKADQRKEGDSDDQFNYNNRKHAIGPFKAAMWGLGEAWRAEMRAEWETQFGLLFDRLGIGGTRLLTDRFVKAVYVPHMVGGLVTGVTEDVTDLAD